MPEHTKPKSPKTKSKLSSTQKTLPKPEIAIETPSPAIVEKKQRIKSVLDWLQTHGKVLDLGINALTFLVVACLGTYLIFKQNGLFGNQNELLGNQNSLLENQNQFIKQQMFLEEASRRGALVMLMSNIMDKVDDEIKEQKSELRSKGISKAAIDKMRFSLSQSLIGQIAALSHSFKPYRYMEKESLIGRPLSPERGQLLITLTLLPLDTFTLHKVYQSATFSSAALQQATLYKADLSGANLDGAALIGADLSEANLSRAILIGADLSEANLDGAALIGADLSEANLSRADLSRADLRGVEFNLAGLNDAGLNDPTWTILRILTIQKLSKAKSLFESIGIHDSIKNELMNKYPKLFEEPKELKVLIISDFNHN